MRERVEIDPNIHFGKPCVAGTRIPVLSVLELVSEGLSIEGIIQDYYPNLQAEDIRACIRYASEFAEEDRKLAEEGMSDYAEGLAREDATNHEH